MATIFLTPSYRGDLERFALLRRSIQRFQAEPIRHVVAVPSSDLSLFRARLSSDSLVEVVVQQDLVDSKFYGKKWYPVLESLLGSRSWRFSGLRGRSGWVIQQVVKLSSPEFLDEGTIVLVDSDLVFLRNFDISEFESKKSSRMLLRQNPGPGSGSHPKYMRKSREMLCLPDGALDHHYMAYPAVWYPDWVLGLRSHLEALHSKPWQHTLFEADWFSEYLLYGIYIEEILKPEGLDVTTQRFHHGVWDKHGFESFVKEVKSKALWSSDNSPLTLVVQSNIGLDVEEYLSVIDPLVNSASR